jgi:hypothetical protein
MVEITEKRCFVLWTEDKRGNIRFDPTVFTSAHALITHAEQQKDKGAIADYNYSVVFCPQIRGELPKEKVLTSEGRAPSIEL